MWSLIIGRFICGVAGGVSCVLAPIFIGEIADKNSRVRLLTYFQLLLNFGMFYAFLTTYLLDERDSIFKYSLICAISSAPIVLVGLLHESPLYYLMNNNENAAMLSMRWYRGRDCDEELEQLRGLVKRKCSVGPVSQILNIKIIIEFILAIIYQFYFIIVFYPQDIIELPSSLEYFRMLCNHNYPTDEWH